MPNITNVVDMDEWLDVDTNVNLNIFVHMIVVQDNKSWDIFMVKSDDNCYLWLSVPSGTDLSLVFPFFSFFSSLDR